MGISDYMKALRQQIGPALVLAPGVAAIVRDSQGRVLLQKRSDNHEWGLPAGAIDPGESPAQALLREVWEETGLRVVPVRVAGVFGGADGFRFTYLNGDQVEYTVIVFECRVVGGTLCPRDGEALELRYFDPTKMPPLRAGYPRALFTRPSDAHGVFYQWDDSWLSTCCPETEEPE